MLRRIPLDIYEFTTVSLLFLTTCVTQTYKKVKYNLRKMIGMPMQNNTTNFRIPV